MAVKVEIIVTAQDRASGKLKSIVGSLKSLKGISFGGIISSLTRIGVVAGGAVLLGITALTAAMAAMVAQGIAGAANLESQLDAVTAILGASEEQAQGLEETIRSLALDPTLKVNAVEAAQAVEVLAKNGLTADEIMQGAAFSSVLLANATGTTLANAANIATDAMAIFGIAAEDSSTAIDGIVAVTNNSKFSIDDYALALAAAGGTADAVGVGFDDLNTAIVAISPAFKSGRTAGTSFKNLLLRLAPSTEPAKDAMAELGIITAEGANQFFDAEGNIKSLAEISGVLQTALSGLSDEQSALALKTIFGNDAIGAAVGLAKIGEENFSALADTLGDTSAVDQAAIRMDNLKGALEIFKGIIESIQLSLGKTFLPLLTGLTRQANDFFSVVAEGVQSGMEPFEQALTFLGEGNILGFFSQLRTSVLNLLLAFGAGQPALLAFTRISGQFIDRLRSGESVIESLAGVIFSNLSPTLQNIITKVILFSQAVSDFVSQHGTTILAVITALGAAFGGLLVVNTVISIITAIGAVLAAIISPIGLIIGLITLLAVAWSKNWGDIQGKTQAVVSFVVGLIKRGLASIQAFWIENGDRIVTAVTGAWGVVKTFIADTIKTTRSRVLSFLSDVAMWWEENKDQIISAAVTAWQGISKAIGIVVSRVKPAIQDFTESATKNLKKFQPVLEELSKLWVALQPVIKALGVIIVAVFLGILAIVTGVVTALANAIDPFLSTLSLVVQGLIQAFTGLVTFLTGTFDLIVALFTGNREKVFASLLKMRDGGIQIILGLAKGIGGLIFGLWETVKAIFVGMVTGVAGFFESMFNISLASVVNMVGSIILAWANLVPKAIQIFLGLLGGIGDIFGALGANVRNKIATMVIAVSGLFIALNSTIVGTINSFVLKALILIAGFSTQVTEKIKALVSQVVLAFQEWRNDSTSSVIDLVAKVKTAINTFVSDVGTSLLNFVTEAIKLFATFRTDAKSEIDTMILNIISALAPFVTDFVAKAKDGVTGFIKAFSDTDWAQVGIDVIGGIVNGVSSGVSALVDAGGSAAAALIGGATSLLESQSPSKLAEKEIGKSYTDGIIVGLSKGMKGISSAVDDVIGIIVSASEKLDVASALGQAGNFFAGLQQDKMSGITNELSVIDKELDAIQQSGDRSLFALSRVTELQAKRNKLQTQFADEQERIAKLEKQRADVAFLQQQLGLLQTIRDAGLNPAEILSGITLGLDASLPDLIDAMTAAMGALVGAAEEELGIASPSKVFFALGEQLKNGLISSLSDTNRLKIASSAVSDALTSGFDVSRAIANTGDAIGAMGVNGGGFGLPSAAMGVNSQVVQQSTILDVRVTVQDAMSDLENKISQAVTKTVDTELKKKSRQAIVKTRIIRG